MDELPSTYQDPARGGLARDELPRPVLGFCHKVALHQVLGLGLAGGLALLLRQEFLLLLLFLILGRIPIAAAEEGEGPPYQHYEDPGQEGEDTRQQEAPPFSFS